MNATTNNVIDALYRISPVDGTMPMLALDQLTDDEARREGAMASMRALAKLIKSAGEYYDTPEPATKNEAAEAFHVRRANDAKALADAIGPLSPFQEGAVLAMAELLHEMTTTGEPLLDNWMPCAAMTTTQYRAEIKRLVAGMDGE